ncbi:MAG: ABC transporter permease subunit [Mycoplasma sp.]
MKQIKESIKFNLIKDSFLYGRKRKTLTKNILATVFSIVSALVVALLVATSLGYNPFDVLSKLFYVGFNDPVKLFSNIGVFCFAAFAFSFASRVGLFNIGISGQMLASGTFIVFLTTKWIPAGTIPTGAGQLIILLVGMLVGAAVASFVGLLETQLKVNSVVSSILLNWIIYFVCFFFLATYAPNASGQELTGSLNIPDEYRLWSTNGSGGIIPIIVLTIIAALFMLFIFKFTVFGHKIKSVGLSESASKYAGYNVKAIKLSSFAISGALSGILACILYTTTSIPSIDLNLNLDSIPVQGFNGIAISLIANNNPLAIIAVGSLFALFQNSLPGIVIPPTYIDLLFGLLMIGAALSVVVLKWKPWKYIKSFKYDFKFYKKSEAFENNMDALITKYKSICNNEKKLVYNQIGDKLEKNEVWKETLDEITQDYFTEKTDLMESWKITKVQLMIEKNIVMKESLENKEKQLKKYYDLALTKELVKLETKIDESKQRARIWFNEDISKLHKKFKAKSDDNISLDEKIMKIRTEIENIQDPIEREKLLSQLPEISNDDLVEGGN